MYWLNQPICRKVCWTGDSLSFYAIQLVLCLAKKSTRCTFVRDANVRCIIQFVSRSSNGSRFTIFFSSWKDENDKSFRSTRLLKFYFTLHYWMQLFINLNFNGWLALPLCSLFPFEWIVVCKISLTIHYFRKRRLLAKWRREVVVRLKIVFKV